MHLGTKLEYVCLSKDVSVLQRNFCEVDKMLAFLLMSVEEERPTKTLLLLTSS